MSTFLWVLQVILALMFAMAGMMKLMRSKEQLGADPRMGWTETFEEGQIKAIGGAEVLAALGLILPGLTDVGTILTPLAAVGLVIVMIGAFRLHRQRGESVMMVAGLGVLALIVAIGRFATPL